jgi:hypothetical protein
LPLVLIFTGIAVFVKPLIIIIILGQAGYKKRVAFLTGNIMSQVSEFSLIIAGVGRQMGKLDQSIASVIVMMAVFTIIISSYLAAHDDKLYKRLKKALGFLPFKDKGLYREKREKRYEDHIILVGCHRMGFDLIAAFDKLEASFVVLDFDPKIVRQLGNMGIDVVYGDIGDPEILEDLDLNKARMVISTVPNYHDNLALIDEVKRINSRALIWVTAAQVSEASKFYRLGADYVILPHLLGGHYISLLLNRHWGKWDDFQRIKKRHISELLRKKNIYHMSMPSWPAMASTSCSCGACSPANAQSINVA